jgi:hypothetical protein
MTKPVLNQGNYNSCVGNTFTQICNTQLFTSVRTAKNVSWFTEGFALQLYSRATHDDGMSQYYYPPNDDGSTALGGAKAAQDLGLIDRYEHTFTFDAFRAALQRQPVCVGTLWTQDMFNPDPVSGLLTVNLGDPNDPNNTNIAGGHEYLALGLDYTHQWVIFLTSWGPSFGLDGRFKISFADFATLLAAEGDVVVPHGIGMP